jgi:hypothetical protein
MNHLLFPIMPFTKKPTCDLPVPGRARCEHIFPNTLLVAGKHNPELLAEYVAVEKRIGHKFRVDLSMADLQAAVQAGEAPRQVEGWKA